MKYLIINNLVSGYQQGTIYDFIRLLASDGNEIVLRSSNGTTDMRTMLWDAEKYDLVVASGGDKTVSTVAYQLANTKIPILVFPAGKTNLIANNLWLPNEPHALARLARERKTIDFDLGEIQLGTKKHGFAVMADCGYDATIMQDAKHINKLFGPAAYFGATINNISPTHSNITLTIDGKVIETEGVGVLVINFSKMQFDLSVTSKNQPNDGLLDVIVLRVNNAMELLPIIGSALLGRSGDSPGNNNRETYRGKKITIETNPPLPIQYDVELTQNSTPFTAQVLSKAMRLVVGEEAQEQFS